jgi:putative transposase
MQLVERHIIKKSNPEWKILDHLCFLSKNLYNYSLYRIKEEFQKSGHYYYYNEMEKNYGTQINLIIEIYQLLHLNNFS